MGIFGDVLKNLGVQILQRQTWTKSSEEAPAPRCWTGRIDLKTRQIGNFLKKPHSSVSS